MFYGLPNEFALRSRPKVGLPKNKAQNPVVENHVFPFKIAMFRYTPISGKKPHQQFVGYISNRVPIISDTISHVIFR